jgi:hypothetical protein
MQLEIDAPTLQRLQVRVAAGDGRLLDGDSLSAT